MTLRHAGEEGGETNLTVILSYLPAKTPCNEPCERSSALLCANSPATRHLPPTPKLCCAHTCQPPRTRSAKLQVPVDHTHGPHNKVSVVRTLGHSHIQTHTHTHTTRTTKIHLTCTAPALVTSGAGAGPRLVVGNAWLKGTSWESHSSAIASSEPEVVCASSSVAEAGEGVESTSPGVETAVAVGVEAWASSAAETVEGSNAGCCTTAGLYVWRAQTRVVL